MILRTGCRHALTILKVASLNVVIDKVFTSIHPVKNIFNNMVLRGEHFFIKYSPGIHLFTFCLFFVLKGEGYGEH